MSSEQNTGRPEDAPAAAEAADRPADSGQPQPLLRWGSGLLMLAGVGLIPASRVIGFRDNPGALLALGRRLYAGGLATLALALLLITLAAVPLRRGEKWAFWAYAGVAGIFGLPMITIGTLYVPVVALARTLAPQFAELALVCAGLAVCAQELYGRK